MIHCQNLKARRLELGITMRGAACLMGFKSPCGYFRIEHGQSRVTVTQLQRLAEIFGLSLEELVGQLPIVGHGSNNVEPS